MRWNIGIDLGTENLRMVEAGYASILDAPALLVFRDDPDAPAAAGSGAGVLWGRTGPDARAVTPLRDGVLENNRYAELLLNWALRQQDESRRARRTAALITQAPHARPVQQEALLRAALDAGAAEAALIRSDVAAALGAGLDILAPAGCMLVDVGAGSMTASVFSLGRLAVSRTLPYGLNRVDAAIAHLLRAEQGFLVGPRAVQELKHTLGGALASGPQRAPMAVAGIDLVKRQPEMRAVAPELVWRACEGLVRELTQLCNAVVEEIPEELAADLNDAGLTLAGGGAMLPGLDKRLGDELGIACRIEESPAACAAKGLAVYINNTRRYEQPLRWALSPVARK